MKKIFALVACLSLVASLAVGGSIAYLQDQKSTVNVMTLGKVEIEQIEQARDIDGNLVDFKDGNPAYPAVGPVEWADKGVVVNDIEYKVFTPELKNVVDKIVTVKNTGKSDAFVRTIIAIEAPDYDPNDLIHINYNTTGVVTSAPFTAEIDGVKYVCFAFTYSEALKPGQISAPSLMQLFLDSKTTNEDCAKFGETWEILVMSQAVQAAGFDAAATALNTAFGELTTDNHPWKNTVLVDTNDEAELKTALSSGKDVILNTDIVTISDSTFDGNGTKVDLAGAGDGSYGYLSFDVAKNSETTVKNLSVTGSGFVEVGHYFEDGISGGTKNVNNVKVENLSSTLANGDKGFTLGCAFVSYGKVNNLTDCVVTGTTTTQEGSMPVDLGCINDTTTNITRGKYGTIYCWSHAIVNIEGAEVDTLQVAPIKGTVTVKAGTHVKTINVAYGTSDSNTTKARLQKLVIDQGATVDKIVFRNNTYTVSEWNAFVDTFQ